jgi:ubiquinone/menaquinone biosynthesis C-methylase UbiE
MRMIMDYQEIAAQLRRPAGKLGIGVSEQMNIFNKEINTRAIGLLDVGKDEKVLEIGMGNGMFCSEILRYHDSATYSGCDHSELMVREAFARNREWTEKGRADFFLAEVSKLPFPDGYFSRVFTVNTIYFWDDPLQGLCEIKRVLACNGLAVIGIRTKASMVSKPYVQDNFRLFDEPDLAGLLEAAGFRHVETILERHPENGDGSAKKLDSLFGLGRK